MTTDIDSLREHIERAFTNRSLIRDAAHALAIESVVALLDEGALRVATRQPDGWAVHPWLKQAILLYFALRPMEKVTGGAMEYQDKIPTKRLAEGVRVVPGAVVRHGAYVARGAIVMPGFVNIGAYVDSGTMVDTWATVGSCAQIGRDVHLAGGVGIGGVLEPPGARPVIIEDGVFVGSRAIVVEGVLIESEAVIGAGVVLTSSTAILDVTGKEVKELRGRVPARSVVIPGTRTRSFPAGEFQVPCALIIGTRSESTDRKTSLEKTLRELGVQA